MVLQIWLWESSTVPDFYLWELKYSHCLSSFFLCVRGGWVRVGVWGGAACKTRRFCCLVVIKVIEINFITFITPIHHHPCSVKSVPSYSDCGRCLAGGKAVLRLKKSFERLRLSRCSASSTDFLWESSTALHNDWDWLETGFIRGASRIKRRVERPKKKRVLIIILSHNMNNSQ